MNHAVPFRIIFALFAAAAAGVAGATSMQNVPLTKIDFVDGLDHRVQIRMEGDAFAQIALTLDKGVRVVVDVSKLGGVSQPDLANAKLWFDGMNGVMHYSLRIPFDTFGELDDDGYELIVSIDGAAAVRAITVRKRSMPGGKPVACLDGDCSHGW